VGAYNFLPQQEKKRKKKKKRGKKREKRAEERAGTEGSPRFGEGGKLGFLTKKV